MAKKKDTDAQPEAHENPAETAPEASEIEEFEPQDDEVSELSPDEPEDTVSEDAASEDAQDAAPADAESVEPADTASEVDPSSEPPAEPPAAAPAEKKSGPGVFALFFGGIVAAGLGYFAAIMGLGGFGASEEDTAVTDQLAAQEAALSALTEDTATLTETMTGLSAIADGQSDIESALAALSEQMSAQAEGISEFGERLSALEARPVLSGDAGADEVAMAAAMDALRAELADQQSENEAMAEEIRSLAESAEASVAEAEARVASASIQAAFSELRIAAAAGTPFAGALTDLSESTGVAVPEALAGLAETGIPTLEEIAETFPAFARDALPVALREEVSDGDAAERFTAFMQGQFGGRSLTPQEGPGADAVLSRAAAAVETGDIASALSELSALPEAAQEVLNPWRELAATRSDALDALDDFAAELDAM